MTAADAEAEQRHKPGYGPHRVVMFVDAIFAIAITLLAIELPRPGEDDMHSAGSLWRFLNGHGSSFIAFVLAFLMLWWVWRTHHAIFDQVARMSQWTLGLHIPLLLAAVWMPYPTEVFGHSTENPLAVALFAGTEGVMMLCLGLMSAFVLKQHNYLKAADPVRLRVEAAVNIAIGLYWVLTALVAFVMPGTPYLWFGTAVVAYATARLARGGKPKPA